MRAELRANRTEVRDINEHYGRLRRIITSVYFYIGTCPDSWHEVTAYDDDENHPASCEAIPVLRRYRSQLTDAQVQTLSLAPGIEYRKPPAPILDCVVWGDDFKTWPSRTPKGVNTPGAIYRMLHAELCHTLEFTCTTGYYERRALRGTIQLLQLLHDGNAMRYATANYPGWKIYDDHT